MVKKFFELFNKEISGLHEAAYLLGACALGSQILGIFRDRLLAARFGAGMELDVYYAAFRIPDFLFVTVASLVSISVLLPVLIARGASDPFGTRQLINQTFSFFSLVIALSSVMAFLVAPYLVPSIFSGLPQSEFPRLVLLTRILLLSPILLGLSNFFACLTQLHRRFFVYALTPLAYNVGIILGIILFAEKYGNIGVVIGVVIGAFLHGFIQLPFLLGKGIMPRLTPTISWNKIKAIVLLSIPRTLTLGMGHLVTIVLLGIGSHMVAGSISVFTFAWNLQSVPLTIIGMSYSLAAFPVLAAYFAKNQRAEFLAEMVTAARHIVFWSLPLSALFIVLRAQIVRTILGVSPNFDWNDTRLTAAAFAFFAFSVLAQSMVLLLVRGFYAAGKTKAPLYINFLASVITVASAYALLYGFTGWPHFRVFLEELLRVEGIPGTEVLVLPLAYSFGSIVNVVLMWLSFGSLFKGFTRPVFSTLSHSAVASAVTGVVAYVGLNLLDDVFNLTTLPGIFLQGLCAGLIGICAGILTLKISRNRELSEIAETLRHKIWKAKVVGPDAPEQIST